MKEIIHKILEGEYQVDENLSPEDQELDKEIYNKIKTIYDSCMDEDTINKQGKEPIINLLNQFDFYNNTSKYEGVDGLTNLIADIHHYGGIFIFVFGVIGDLIDHDLNVMAITQQNILIPKNYFKDEYVINMYKYVIMELFSNLFEDQINERNIEEIANKIIDFEIKLSDIIIPKYVIIYK